MGIKIIGKFSGVPRNALEEIALQLSLTPKQRAELQRKAIGMARGKGRTPLASTTHKRELALKFKSQNDNLETITAKVNAATGCLHDSSYYKKLLRQREGGQ